jgi:predicted permease
MILNVCYIILATPVGSMTAMMAQQYGGNYSLASRGVALSTLLSVATIPLVALLIG